MSDEAFARLERVVSTGFNTLADLIRETNSRLDQTNSRLDLHEKVLVQLVGEVRVLHQEVRSLNGRFDSFLTGAHRQAHDELAARVDKLEDAVFRRTG